jgi:hypothetical protein
MTRRMPDARPYHGLRGREAVELIDSHVSQIGDLAELQLPLDVLETREDLIKAGAKHPLFGALCGQLPVRALTGKVACWPNLNAPLRP